MQNDSTMTSNSEMPNTIKVINTLNSNLTHGALGSKNCIFEWWFSRRGIGNNPILKVGS